MDHKIPVNPSWPRKKTPESSQIAEIAYNAKDSKLYVHFSTNDSVYEFSPVKPSQWKALENAISTGAYFTKHIKTDKSIRAKSL
jgi:hypothetical protein